MRKSLEMGGTMRKAIFVRKSERKFIIEEDEEVKTMDWEQFYDFISRFHILKVSRIGEGFEVEVA